MNRKRYTTTVAAGGVFAQECHGNMIALLSNDQTTDVELSINDGEFSPVAPGLGFDFKVPGFITRATWRNPGLVAAVIVYEVIAGEVRDARLNLGGVTVNVAVTNWPTSQVVTETAPNGCTQYDGSLAQDADYQIPAVAGQLYVVIQASGLAAGEYLGIGPTQADAPDGIRLSDGTPQVFWTSGRLWIIAKGGGVDYHVACFTRS